LIDKLRARWHARQPSTSRGLWALIIGLDPLPWPWGEEILTRLFMVVGLARPSRRRRAVAWAAVQPGHGRWRLAAAICAFRGRWVARLRLLGVRSPETLRPYTAVEGEEHLTAVPGGVILLSFHIGPPCPDLVLTLRGHPVTYLGWGHRSLPRVWWRDAWRPLVETDPLTNARGGPGRWTAVLYTGRQILLGGGRICIMADGPVGPELFRIPLPGAPIVIRQGWLTLHRLTGAPVLPLLTRFDGRAQVVAIHPALPPLTSDAALAAAREILTALLQDYVRKSPEQCATLALGEPD
jgi:lauroyl/myristoyl acyltransferase